MVSIATICAASSRVYTEILLNMYCVPVPRPQRYHVLVSENFQSSHRLGYRVVSFAVDQRFVCTPAFWLDARFAHCGRLVMGIVTLQDVLDAYGVSHS